MRISLRLRFVLVTMAIAGVTLAGIAIFSRRVTLREIEPVTGWPLRPRRDPESLRVPLLVRWNGQRCWAGMLRRPEVGDLRKSTAQYFNLETYEKLCRRLSTGSPGV